jgi:hypothetical protein
MAMSVYSLAPLIGPSVGPLVGGWYVVYSYPSRNLPGWTFLILPAPLLATPKLIFRVILIGSPRNRTGVGSSTLPQSSTASFRSSVSSCCARRTRLKLSATRLAKYARARGTRDGFANTRLRACSFLVPPLFLDFSPSLLVLFPNSEVILSTLFLQVYGCTLDNCDFTWTRPAIEVLVHRADRTSVRSLHGGIIWATVSHVNR